MQTSKEIIKHLVCKVLKIRVFSKGSLIVLLTKKISLGFNLPSTIGGEGGWAGGGGKSVRLLWTWFVHQMDGSVPPHPSRMMDGTSPGFLLFFFFSLLLLLCWKWTTTIPMMTRCCWRRSSIMCLPNGFNSPIATRVVCSNSSQDLLPKGHSFYKPSRYSICHWWIKFPCFLACLLSDWIFYIIFYFFIFYFLNYYFAGDYVLGHVSSRFLFFIFYFNLFFPILGHNPDDGCPSGFNCFVLCCLIMLLLCCCCRWWNLVCLFVAVFVLICCFLNPIRQLEKLF